METTADTSRPQSVSFVRDAVITIVAVLLAYAAYDDLTTDNATSFTVEYVALIGCAVCLLFVTAQLFRFGRFLLGTTSLTVLAVAIWAQPGIQPGIRPGFWWQYFVTVGALLWFAAIALQLFVSARRHS